MIHAIDLFSGAGGWACAARGLPIRIVAAVDFWEPAAATYRLNHPNADVIVADLRSEALQETIVTLAKEQDVQLVLGGVPCEWLSTYRNLQKVKTAERDENRAALDGALSIVRRIDPRWWCLEDVVQLIRELPLLTPYRVLNAAHWSGQRRKRCFVGDFPMPTRDEIGAAKTLADYVRPGPYRISRRLTGRIPQRSRSFSNKTCLAAELDRKAPTVTAQCSRRDAELALVDPRLPGGMRQIEWQELAAIQGFPPDYLFYGSPTDVSKQVGRAVPIPLAAAILRRICEVYATADQASLPINVADARTEGGHFETHEANDRRGRN